MVGFPCQPEDVIAKQLELTYLRDAERQALRLNLPRRLRDVRQQIAQVERAIREMRRWLDDQDVQQAKLTARREQAVVGTARRPAGTRR